MAVFAVEVSGIVERGFFMLRDIPNAFQSFGLIPRLYDATGFGDFLPLFVEVAANGFGRGMLQVFSGDGKMEVESFATPLAFLIQKPCDFVEVSFPSVSPCEVSHQQMKLFYPLSFVPLAVIFETQITFHHPIGDEVK